jgi:hypothetical protein
MTHYHVGHNMPGYSSDDVYTVATKRDAQRAVADDVKRYRESEWDLPRRERRTASGSARDGYVKFERNGDPYDLGYIYWWSKCQCDEGEHEKDCDRDFHNEECGFKD